jgi:(p)ppGpp synthase/HD superfamily hydrolase
MKLSAKQQLLLERVKEIHEGQKRKYHGQDYWLHVFGVAEILANSIKIPEDSFLIEIALLHDVLEDQYDKCGEMEMIGMLKVCGYSYFDAMFITRAVIELTDVYTTERCPNINRANRKALEAERLGEVSFEAATVKYADLIHNTQDICDHDEGFAKVYLKEKEIILNLMRQGNYNLYFECVRVLEKSKSKLNVE